MSINNLEQMTWEPIETAPRDGSDIVAWCRHDADEYCMPSGELTLYGAHVEGLSCAEDGLNIVQFGGGYDDRTFEEPNAGHLPDWWFVKGSEFEVVANPTHWIKVI